jgi:hypothetical protein
MKNEPAFPTQMWDSKLKEATWLDGGLTKREYFAGLAMQGLLAAVYSDKEMLKEFTHYKTQHGAVKYVTGREAISINALSYADALLKALEDG